MRLLDRYILKHVGLAFMLCLSVLTLLIWLVAALRQFNLLTTQGQSLIIFTMISSLALPSLLVIIGPVALFIAIVWSLNRLNGDSELVVMSAAGLSPWRLVVPYAVLTAIVAAILATTTLLAMPAAQRELRTLLVKVGADVISKMVQPGKFTAVRPGITVHVREKTPNGTLLGVFVQDASAKDQTMTYIAERGQVVETTNSNNSEQREGLFLILEKGSVQRQVRGPDSDSAIVVFENYAFDLSQLIDSPDVTFTKPRERYTGELLGMLRTESADPRRKNELGRIRSELVDRFTAPLYPIAFMFVALAALGQPRTTRQGRASAITAAIAAIVAIRILGFFATQTLSVRSSLGPVVAIGGPVIASILCALVISGKIEVHTPAALREAVSAGLTRLRQRFFPNGSGAQAS